MARLGWTRIGGQRHDRGGAVGSPGRCVMDPTQLLVLALAVAVAVAAVSFLRSRRLAVERGQPPVESPLAVSTEGMKICPRCGMGNLWTERTCSACGTALKG